MAWVAAHEIVAVLFPTMERLLDTIVWIHVVFGCTGLAAFWVPVFSRKGGAQHVRLGKVFALAAYVVGGTAVFNMIARMSAAIVQGADISENREAYGFFMFLCYLGFATLASTRQAVLAVRHKKDPAAMATPFHLTLLYASMAGSLMVIAYALLMWSSVSPVLLALSPVGILTGRRALRYVRHEPHEHMPWFYEHMGNIVGAGIAFHTAFAVFGSTRIFDYDLAGAWNFVPWILPAAIGIPSLAYWERHYRRKFGDWPKGAARIGGRGGAQA